MEKTLTERIEHVMSARFWQSPAPWVAHAGSGDSPPASSLPDHSVAFATSGSTGEPTWIVLSKSALLASAAAVNQHLEITATSRWGLALPIHHVGGFGVCARAHQASCGFSWFSNKWNPVDFTRWLAAETITHTSLVPTQVHDLVAHAQRAPESLRAVVVGGGKLDTADGQAARALGWPILASYGMTETASQIATQNITHLRAPYQPSPLPVLDIWNLRTNPKGQLEISGPALFSGTMIRTHDSWTFQARTNPWFATRDLVELLPDRQIHVVGRSDDLVKILGELVSPTHVESLLRATGYLPSSFPFAIAALPDARNGHRLVAVMEGSEERTALERAIACFHQSCPGPLRVSEIVPITSIPRSPLGKIQRAKLASLMISAPGATP